MNALAPCAGLHYAAWRMRRYPFLRGTYAGLAALAGIAGLTGLAACGGGDDTTDGACWPLASQPGGTAEVGTGDIAFEPLAGTVTVVRNVSQSDPYIEVHSRIHGIPPGNPQDFFDPTNPKTKVSVAIDELGLTLGVECPASIGYVPSPADATGFDMLHSLRVGLGSVPLDQVSGKTARITVEVVGSNQHYATDSQTVVIQLAPVAGPTTARATPP